MIRISNISLPLDFDFSDLKSLAASQLSISSSSIKEVYLYKKSVDARKKDNIKFNCSINVIINGSEKKCCNYVEIKMLLLLSLTIMKYLLAKN